MSGGASLWRANWTETEDPFAHVSTARPDRSTARGPGWQRALSSGYDTAPKRIPESGRSAASFAAKPRTDVAIGARVFHEKFGYGFVTDQEGNKLEIEFALVSNFTRPQVLAHKVRPRVLIPGRGKLLLHGERFKAIANQLNFPRSVIRKRR